MVSLRPSRLQRKASSMAPFTAWLASGAGDRRVMVWPLGGTTLTPRVLKAHKSAVTALAASADGRSLASAGADRLLVVWNVERGKVTSAHPTDVTVNDLCFEPHGKALLLACDDGTLRRWTISSRDERPFSFGDWALWLMRKN